MNLKQLQREGAMAGDDENVAMEVDALPNPASDNGTGVAESKTNGSGNEYNVNAPNFGTKIHLHPGAWTFAWNIVQYLILNTFLDAYRPGAVCSKVFWLHKDNAPPVHRE